MAGDESYPIEVTVRERDDGYIAIHTHEDSAMGRRVLLLNPGEYEELQQTVSGGMEADQDA